MNNRIAPLCTALLLLVGLPASAQEPVTWTNAVGVHATPGSLVRNTPGGAWNAGATSREAIVAGPGHVQFTVTSVLGARAIGLSHGDWDQSNSDIDYALRVASNGYLAVLERGIQRASFARVQVEDVLRVAVSGAGVVTYERNGTVIYTSSTVATFPLHTDSSIYDTAATLSGVVMSGSLAETECVRWTNVVRASTSVEATLTRVGTDGWDAGAVSTKGISNGYVELIVSPIGAHPARVFGLGAEDSNQGRGDIEYAIALTDAGAIQVLESGLLRGTFGTAATGDSLRVHVAGQQVSYLRNGSVFHTSSVPVPPSALPLHVDTSLFRDFVRLEHLHITGTLEPVELALSGPGVSRQEIVTGSGSVSYQGPPENEAVSPRTVGLTLRALGNDAPIAFGFYSDFGNDLWISESGQLVYLVPVAGDEVWRVAVETTTTTPKIRYYVGETFVYESAATPMYPLAAAIQGPEGSSPERMLISGIFEVNEGVSWLDSVHVSTVGNALERKKDAPAGWTSGAVSNRALSAISGGYVEVTASESTTTRTFGLSYENSGTSDADIDYAFYLEAGGALRIREGGVDRGAFGSYAPGTRLRIVARPEDGGTVSYFVESNLVFTSSTAPQWPLIIDTAILTNRGTLGNVRIAGSLIMQSNVATPSFTPAGGQYSAVQMVAINRAEGSTVRYTTDGSTPDVTSPELAAGETLTVSEGTTVKARAWRPGYVVSAVATATYSFTAPAPLISPPSGPYSLPLTVSITAGSGMTIEYSTVPQQPETDWPTYTHPFALSTSTTVRARAHRAGWTPSPIAEQVYTLGLAAPTFSPTPGTWMAPVDVTIQAPGAARLVYSLSGGVTNAVHQGDVLTVPVHRSLTLSATAQKDGMADSGTTSGRYEIDMIRAAHDPPTGSTMPGREGVTLVGDTVLGGGWAFRCGSTVTREVLLDGQVLATALITETPRPDVVDAFADMCPQLSEPSSQTAGYRYEFPTGLLPLGEHVVGVRITDTMGRTNVQERRIYIAPRNNLEAPSGNVRGKNVWVWGWASHCTTPVVATQPLVDDVVPAGTLLWNHESRPDIPAAFGDLCGGSENVREDAGFVMSIPSDELSVGSHSIRVQLAEEPATAEAWFTNTLTFNLSGLLAAGDGASALVTHRGDGWMWGSNNGNRLGVAAPAHVGYPVPVGVTDLWKIDIGERHVVAGDNDGRLWAWGQNDSGQLGRPPDGGSITAVEVPSPLWGWGFSVGGRHTLFLIDEKVYSWGANDFGQLGRTGNTWEILPVLLPADAKAAAVAAGRDHSLVLLTNGTVWGWGRNHRGQLGLGAGSPAYQATPVQLPGLAGVTALFSGSTADHSFAVSGSSVRGWGWNVDGQLGVGSPAAVVDAPEALPALGSIRTIAAGRQHTLFLLTSGEVAAAGANGNGQLGVASVPAMPTPVLVEGFPLIESVAAGTDHSLALAADGSVYAWGGNDQGQLATNSTEPLDLPTQVSSADYQWAFLPTPTLTPAGGHFIDSVTIAMTGAIGGVIRYTLDGTEPTEQSAPYATPLTLARTTKLTARMFHGSRPLGASIAADYYIHLNAPAISRASGRYAAGTTVTASAHPGTLLRYTTDGRPPRQDDPILVAGDPIWIGNFPLRVRAFRDGCEPSPQAVAEYSVVGDLVTTQVRATSLYTLVLAPDGTVWAWGPNWEGALGNSFPEDTIANAPVRVNGLSGIKSISNGGLHHLALDMNGRVWSWGVADCYGTVHAPRMVSGLPPIKKVSEGGCFSLALGEDGRVWSWGLNSAGRLGVIEAGIHEPRVVPVPAGVTFKDISAGYFHSLAVTTDGRVWGWGETLNGKLATTSPDPALPHELPIPDIGAYPATAVSASRQNSVVLRADGRVWTFGHWQVLGGGSEAQHVPRHPTNLPPIKSIELDNLSVLALTSSNTLIGWGNNGGFQLGTGVRGEFPYADYVFEPAPADHPAYVSKPLQMTVAPGHSHLLLEDGRILSWGYNKYGALGAGMPEEELDSPRPEKWKPLITIDGQTRPLIVKPLWMVDDRDGDGLSSYDELWIHHTDPNQADTNGDGIPDGAAIALGISATNLDMDDDGLLNAEELLRGTDPFDSDTDNDGLSDLHDPYPLSPDFIPSPSEGSPPNIFIYSPTGMTPVDQQ